MANSVSILDKCFSSQKEAEVFFRQIRDELFSQKIQAMSPSQNFNLLFELYTKYCTVTNWSIPGEPIAFSAGYTGKAAKNGRGGGTTVSFFVHFSNGAKDDFSFLQAIREIAKAG